MVSLADILCGGDDTLPRLRVLHLPRQRAAQRQEPAFGADIERARELLRGNRRLDGSTSASKAAAVNSATRFEALSMD